MRIRNQLGSGTPFSLKSTREMILNDINYSVLCNEKFNRHTHYLRDQLGKQYPQFFKQMITKYKYVSEYPHFLLDEYVEPQLLEGNEHLIHVLIDNWLYDKPLTEEGTTSKMRMSDICQRLTKLMKSEGGVSPYES